MIAVEIPAALAADPQVIPVDNLPEMFLRVHGQRVALAWRETCSTCDGRGWPLNDGPGLLPPRKPCPDCANGSRMVVGWTAEVEAVVPIVDEAYVFDNAMKAEDRYVTDSSKWPMYASSQFGSLRLITITSSGTTKTSDVRDLFPLEPLADWSPGRYALVLRAAWPYDPMEAPVPCRPFSGFAELDGVAA